MPRCRCARVDRSDAPDLDALLYSFSFMTVLTSFHRFTARRPPAPYIYDGLISSIPKLKLYVYGGVGRCVCCSWAGRAVTIWLLLLYNRLKQLGEDDSAGNGCRRCCCDGVSLLQFWTGFSILPTLRACLGLRAVG